MTTFLIIAAVLVTVIAALVVWRIQATISGGRKAYMALAARIEPVERSLEAGEDPSAGHLERFARDRETRRVLHEALEHHQKLHLFPPEFATAEALSEADLVLWLAHPNELGATPDEIELMGAVPAPGEEFAGQQYFVYRFRTHPPHWAAKDGWLAGVSGPRAVSGPATASANGTFSRFEAFDSKLPEEHVRSIHELVVGRK